MNVQDIMTTEPVTVNAGAPYKDVVAAVLDAGVDGLVVIDSDGAVVGIVTESDLLPKMAFGDRHHGVLAAVADVLSARDGKWSAKAEASSAWELMSTRLVTATADEDLHVVARRMLTDGLGRLPVVDAAGKLLGVVSRADILRTFLGSDHALMAEVKTAIAGSDDSEESDVNFSIDDGVVNLAGSVATEDGADHIVAAVRAVPGVVDVDSKLWVRHAEHLESHESLIDRMRVPGFGVQDPGIVGDAGPTDVAPGAD